MRPRWIWLGAALLYALFSTWYVGCQSPLQPEEIDGYLARFETRGEAADAERLSTMRAFLEADDGREFFMLNLLRLREGPVEMPGEAGEHRAGEVLERYTGFFMPRLLRRAGHPAFFGRAAGSYVEHWGVPPDPGWSVGAAVRYRSRRDLMELATDPAFRGFHDYKLAALANTLAFPVTPGGVLIGPRLWVALVLALFAALLHLAVGRRPRA